MSDPVDPVALTSALVKCPSVTPEEGGALVLLEELLSGAGFRCTRIDRNGTPNLYARFGEQGPCLGFNGHTDVVPTGDPARWTRPPFSGEIADGMVWGRGACDMKSGVAAFAAAAVDAARQGVRGSLALMITGDEEGPSTDGTTAILEWMEREGEKVDHCLVGEPTSRESFGDMVKIGRRGAITATITATGRQGHSAYPHKALNPLPPLAALAAKLAAHELDQGSEHFQPSTLALVAIETGNPAANVIPGEAKAVVNIRFNDLHTGASLKAWLEAEAAEAQAASGVTFQVATRLTGESFLTPPGVLSDLISSAIRAETGATPELSTSGGTSDARFVKDHCPVAEFGLTGLTMHQTDECAPVAEIEKLKAVYARIIRDYFA
ncbi:succinyl-diaminopimelate desuccinylase [Albimonas sp. CAU 1670]|uniref:succinyl-diaminopimelate desuccinylase n=1 Tax=Albimonas sp. CAU 1670 TaxID=3032599 RepID=UPI0023DB2090|nr:succinyl-diaminopimelate desuccinylase [Albimonas sp. CAU 1670]MDF2231606.1 succinyl-diaminopimelate desuccinylase [Albimonas sp. CAU 1670]